MAIYKEKQNGRLYIQFQYKGRTIKERLPEGTSKRQARDIEQKLKSDVLMQRHELSISKNELYEKFVREIYLPYVKDNLSEVTYAKTKIILENSLPFFKGKTIREIKPSDIEKFKSHRATIPTIHKTVRKPATVLRELCIIGKLFSMAVKNDLCDYNPMSRVEKPKFDNVQNLILQPTDEEKLFQNMYSDWVRDVCKIVLNTGLRQNDVLGLRKTQVDWDNGAIVLVQGKTKRRVEIPMNRIVIAILASRKELEGQLFFPSPKTGENARSVKNTIIRACRRAEIPELTIRDLRRTFGTRLHEKGFDDSTVAQLLGHSDLRSIHRYKRGSEIKKKAVAALE